ncbi:MAG: hypothetical protein ACRD2S_02120 [Terriglobales bacterium]
MSILTLALFAGTFVVPTFAASPATTAFHQLQGLVGNWEGTGADGMKVKSTFQLIAGDTAVMETLAMAGMDPMVSLYSIDGNSISLLHYCPTNNQPRLRATPPTGEVRRLVFTFESAGNLPDITVGHEYRLIMDFQDKDHIVEHWTWRQNGKDTEMIYHLERKGA